jgi:hypothetical protein
LSLAVSVLQRERPAEDREGADAALRRMAVGILVKYSPVTVDPVLLQMLEKGEVTLPAEFNVSEFNASEFATGARARGRAEPQLQAPAAGPQ